MKIHIVCTNKQIQWIFIPRLWILFWGVSSLADKKKLIIYYYVSKLKMRKKW